MKYAHEVMDLMGAYPARSFRMVELVRHVTRGRALTVKERDATRKAVQRVLDALVESGTVRAYAAEGRGGFAEYSMSHLWDMTPEKVGREVRQFPRALAS
ncbi:hypothetical protein [Bordetella bronchiseptica]|uniref:hypothetical protein n=1 Tax=Bordetella bronchiseptica TaxID=518 RepID=UPI0012459193|nr:hypothetical protein [Bordetella bronchiseptica]KAB1444192.1 hypothetical protein F7D00_21270 [Bordetella bronchiseptica]KAB1569298.1 hypothetical protein F7890_21270 [Bordetella bronchiseptica]